MADDVLSLLQQLLQALEPSEVKVARIDQDLAGEFICPSCNLIYRTRLRERGKQTCKIECG